MARGLLRAIALGAGLALASVAEARPVLLISIDGLRPGDVLEARQRGLKLPNLSRFVTEGAYARAVRGVLPTVTYPSHTTLVTGTAPAAHGIFANTTFDPTQINADGWYWYASDIRRETLWDAAAASGLTTANVHWPVSVGAAHIRWNLPQIWRSGHGDDRKLQAALATPGLLAELGNGQSEYAAGIDESPDGDELRGAYATRLIGAHKPDFITVYLTALDHAQHVYGPDTPEAHGVLERIDAIIGKLVAAETAAHPDAVIAVASDHGFGKTDHEISFFRAFIDAGLMKLGADGKVAGWDAVPWISGGSVAIVLAHPQDKALVGKVGALLGAMQANPANRIAKIIGADDIARMGGNPEASFYINLGEGMMAAGYKGGGAPLLGPSHYKAMHGYFPDDPRMRSTFLVMGAGIAQGRDLGEIDMRAIAPTLAAALGVRLPRAEAGALAIVARP